MAAAADANCAADASCMSSIKAVANAPLKASPAAVVSNAITGYGGVQSAMAVAENQSEPPPPHLHTTPPNPAATKPPANFFAAVLPPLPQPHTPQKHPLLPCR